MSVVSGYKLDLVVKDKERPQIQLDVPQNYIPKHLADKILATRRSIEGEETTYSPLADVKGSASIGETLDPEELRSIIQCL
jgi:hypothetical protein